MMNVDTWGGILQAVVLEFVDMDLESDVGCPYDRIILYDSDGSEIGNVGLLYIY